MLAPFCAIGDINTQVRRLRYVSAIIDVLRTDHLSHTGIMRRLVRWSEQHAEDLDNYPVQTGRVCTAASAGTRYLSMASSLQLLSHVATQYRITKIGNVLRIILSNQEARYRDTFALSTSEKALYLFLIFRNDQDFFAVVLGQLAEKSSYSLKSLQNDFYPSLMHRLQLRIETTQEKIARTQLMEKLRELNAWKNPVRYAEHIVPPRLHWLFDLGLIDADCFYSHRYSLNSKGEQLFSSLPLVASTIVEVSEKWMETSYFGDAATSLMENSAVDFDLRDDHGLLMDLVQKAFDALRTEFVPRVPMQELSLLVSIWMLEYKGIRLNLSEIGKILHTPQSLAGSSYQAVFAARANERYIIRRSNKLSNET